MDKPNSFIWYRLQRLERRKSHNNMTTLTRTILLLLVAFLTCSASTIIFVNDPNGASAPYILDIYPGGSTATGPFISVVAPCLSTNLEISGGEQWQATEVPVIDFANPTVATGPQFAALKQIVWLDSQFNSQQSNSVTLIQQAIWDEGEAMSGVGPSFTDSGTNGWLSQAAANAPLLTTSTLNLYAVLVPAGDTYTGEGLNTPSSSPQYFLVPATATPEPSPFYFILGGIGLMVLGKIGRKSIA